MKRCTTCGTRTAPIRDDAECFRCHIRGIGVTFHGGARHGREHWNISKWDHLHEHVGDMSAVTKVG